MVTWLTGKLTGLCFAIQSVLNLTRDKINWTPANRCPISLDSSPLSPITLSL